LAVVLAAVALALAASRVWFWAVVRVRRPVVFDGDLAAVERVVLRVVVRELRLRVAAAFLAAALRFAAEVLLVPVVVVAIRVSPSSGC
jgi:hypothetical protein